MDSLNDILIDCVKALGGSKQVGPMLWPEKTPDTAQRTLLDCLNPERSAHLTPEHVLLILRKARQAGYHEGIGYILSDLGYAPTTPVEPRDEAAELQRQFIEAMKGLQSMAARLEQLQQPADRPALRAAA